MSAKIIMRTGLILMIAFLLNGFGDSKTDPWQLKKSENGISVFTRNIEESDYKELKAVYQIKTSMSSIIALLNDVDSYPLWIYRCKTSKTLKKSSDQDLVRYQTVKAPWPVDDRDMVLQAHSYQDPKTGIVYQKVTCMPEYIPKAAGHVRIKEFRAMWTLTPLKNGMVEVEYQLLVNPGGNVPAWVINMAVVDGPYETSVRMKEWVMKEKYQTTHYSFIADPH